MPPHSRIPLDFRLATPSEAPLLTTLINIAFRGEATGETWLFDSQDKRRDIVSLSDVTTLIAGPETVVLVGVLPTKVSEPVATCFVRKPSSPPPAHMTAGSAWLGLLAVDVRFHRAGLGFSMLRYAEGFVKEKFGAGRVEMDFVSSRVQMREWYERRGYRATGKTREFPYGESGREILAAGLEMVVLGKDL